MSEPKVRLTEAQIISLGEHLKSAHPDWLDVPVLCDMAIASLTPSPLQAIQPPLHGSEYREGFIDGQSAGLDMAVRQAELSTRPIEITIPAEPSPEVVALVKALRHAEVEWSTPQLAEEIADALLPFEGVK